MINYLRYWEGVTKRVPSEGERFRGGEGPGLWAQVLLGDRVGLSVPPFRGIKKPALVNRFRQEQHLVKYHSAQEDICCI
jgi:hypothetical protein